MEGGNITEGSARAGLCAGTGRAVVSRAVEAAVCGGGPAACRVPRPLARPTTLGARPPASRRDRQFGVAGGGAAPPRPYIGECDGRIRILVVPTRKDS